MESSVIAYICDAAVETTRMVGANAYKVYRLDKQGDVALEHLFPSTTHLTPPPANSQPQYMQNIPSHPTHCIQRIVSGDSLF